MKHGPAPAKLSGHILVLAESKVPHNHVAASVGRYASQQFFLLGFLRFEKLHLQTADFFPESVVHDFVPIVLIGAMRAELLLKKPNLVDELDDSHLQRGIPAQIQEQLGQRALGSPLHDRVLADSAKDDALLEPLLVSIVRHLAGALGGCQPRHIPLPARLKPASNHVSEDFLLMLRYRLPEPGSQLF